ncbi:TonB-dependent receptor domain-containing protein [Bacteroidota bacterium]
MKKIFLSIMLLLNCAFNFAQKNSVDIFVYEDETKSPLMGATIHIKALNIGATSDFDGKATLSNLPKGTYEVRISYVGYKNMNVKIQIPQTRKIAFYLEQSGEELEEIVLKTTRSSRTIQKTPTRVEFIGLEELGEKSIMNPANISMVLRESTGIQMQQNSLSSGSTNIRIQGLDGRYTQLLRDGFPLYGGFSGGLSIMQIPPLDLKQFEIIKGSSSTLYGGGAIAGLVNLISKTPEEDPDLTMMFTQTNATASTYNAFYSKRNEKYGMTLYGSGHYQKAYDPEDDDFSNLPETKSLSFNPKFFYYPNEESSLQIGLNGTYDERLGGDVNYIKNGASGEHQYFEKNLSKRISSQTLYFTNLSENKSLELKNSIAFFDRNLELQDYQFKGKQINSFSEIRLSTTKKSSEFTFGANLYTINFDEIVGDSKKRDQKEITTGVFANSVIDFSENWILESGIRTDYSSDWGWFVLPRISVLYKNDKGFSSRLGGGLGYKNPDIFTTDAEKLNYKNILPISSNNLKAEKSYGINYDVNYKTRIFNNNVGFSINQLFYATSIKSGLLLEESLTKSSFYEFTNATESILSKGAETNIKFKFKDFKWFLNYALIDTKLNYLPGNPQKNFTAKHNAGSVLMYETEKWRIGYETYYTGKQLLKNNNTSNDFITMGLMLVRNLSKGSVFINFENFTDQRQSSFSDLVDTSNSHSNPDFADIYTPTDGYIFSIGFIWKPFQG